MTAVPVGTRMPEQWPRKGADRTSEFTLIGLFDRIRMVPESSKTFMGLGTPDHPVLEAPSWWCGSYEDAGCLGYFELNEDGLPI